jgi:hypothetical protein
MLVYEVTSRFRDRLLIRPEVRDVYKVLSIDRFEKTRS